MWASRGHMLRGPSAAVRPLWRAASFAESVERWCATSAAAPARRTAPLEGPTLADFMPEGAGGCSTGGLKRPPPMRKPKWLKMQNPNLTEEGGQKYKKVLATVKDMGFATVCQEARCPNIGECWAGGTATVMIMGDTCTRGCRFCAVKTSRAPPPVDPSEPANIALTVSKLGLDYIVLTMVDRDDLPDQGTSHIVETVTHIKHQKPGLRVETLVGDFQGRLELVEQVVNCGMEVFAHNIETVESLQGTVRDRRAGYAQSLRVLQHAKLVRPDVVTKSSIMLGLGEADEEVHQTMRDLRDIGVEVVTFGQYLQPTKRHMKVVRYVDPKEFDNWRVAGEALGLHVASGPMVRSSYRAQEYFNKWFPGRGAAGRAPAPEGRGPVELRLPERPEPAARGASMSM